MSEPSADDKLGDSAASEPAVGFDVAAADALEIDYPVTSLSRLLVFANPKAGKGEAEAILGRASQLLRIEKIVLDVHHASNAEDLCAAAHGANLAGVDGVLVLGGDGTLNAVVHGLLTRPKSNQPPPPLALLPCGTGNALALDLGLPNPETGLKHLLAGATRPIDVLSLNAGGRHLHAVSIVGWGLAADVAERAKRWKLLGQRGYRAATRLEAIRSRPRYARLELQYAGRAEETTQGRYTMVVLANTRHTGRGLLVAPRAQLDDGLIDLIEVLPVSLKLRIQTLRNLRDGSHIDTAAVRWRRARSVTLSQPSMEELFGEGGAGGGNGKGGGSGKAGGKTKQREREPFRLNLDGDIVDLPADAEVSIKVLPRALRVFAPKAEAAGKTKG